MRISCDCFYSRSRSIVDLTFGPSDCCTRSVDYFSRNAENTFSSRIQIEKGCRLAYRIFKVGWLMGMGRLIDKIVLRCIFSLHVQLSTSIAECNITVGHRRFSDAADQSIQPLVGHLCQSIVFATVILYYWSFHMYYYSYYYRCIVPFIINAMQSLLKSSLCQSNSLMHKVKHCTSCLSLIIDCGLQLMLRRSDHYSDYTSGASQEKKRT